MDLGVNILLAHEMMGEGQEAKFGCEFASLFSSADGATPTDLLQRGIYSQIAVPLKGGAWREVSMVLLGKALGMRTEGMQAEESDEELALRAGYGLMWRLAARRGLRRGLTVALEKVWSPTSSPSTPASLSSRRPSKTTEIAAPSKSLRFWRTRGKAVVATHRISSRTQRCRSPGSAAVSVAASPFSVAESTSAHVEDADADEDLDSRVSRSSSCSRLSWASGRDKTSWA